MTDNMTDNEHRLEIVPVDVHDAGDFDAWHAAYFEADRFGREDLATAWQLEELRVQMQHPGVRQWLAGFSGLVDGRVVTTGCIGTPLLDNLELASVWVNTVPGARRRAHGSAMLAHLEGVARGRGRTLVDSETHWPYDGGEDGVGTPGPDFLRRHGYALGLGDIYRLAGLPVADEVLDRLAADAAPHHATYTLRSWVGPVPDDLVQGWAELTASLMTEAPMGDLQREPERADPAVVRESEAVVAKQGRTKYNTVALDADGTVVAYTDIASSAHEPDRAYQWGTLVRRADRGHRLGLGVKVANLRLLQQEMPEIRRLVTYNAEVNSHMIGVNELLGFRPVERMGEFQKRLG